MDFVAVVRKLVETLFGELPQILTVFFIVWAAFAAYSVAALKKPATVAAIRVQLQRRKPAVVYRDLMAPRLEALSRWLTPQTVAEHPKPPGFWAGLRWYLTPRAPDADAARRVGTSPFSWRVFDAALLVAVAYPLVLLVGTWATGTDGRIGPAVVLRAEPNAWLRGVAMGVIAILLLFPLTKKVFASSRLRVLRQISWLQIAGVAGLIAGVVAFEIEGAAALVGASAFRDALGLASVLAFAIAGAAAGTGTFTGALAFALAGAYVGAVALTPPSIAVAAADLAVFPLPLLALTLAMAAGVTASVAGAIAVALAVTFATRRDRGVAGYLLLVTGLLAALILLAGPTGLVDLDAANQGLYLFLGVLPLLNGLFDWISYGITLGLIRAGLRSGTGVAALLGLLDIGAALLLFTALGAAIIAAVAAINSVAGGVVYDLQAVFDDLRDPLARGDYLWLYAMMFSTALPTLLHAALASLSLQGFYPWTFRQRMLGWMDRAGTDLDAEVKFHVAFSLMRTVSLLAPVALVVGIGAALWRWHGVIGGTYLQIFEWWAGWLGQIGRTGPGLLPAGVWT